MGNGINLQIEYIKNCRMKDAHSIFFIKTHSNIGHIALGRRRAYSFLLTQNAKTCASEYYVTYEK